MGAVRLGNLGRFRKFESDRNGQRQEAAAFY
jgi:hypothetical protein